MHTNDSPAFSKAPLATDPTDAIADASVTAPDLALEAETAQLIVTCLNLEVSAEQVDPQAPLYGDGLGLDSIDILEMALAISKRYGFKLRSDDKNNKITFSSLRTLCQHIAQERTK